MTRILLVTRNLLLLMRSVARAPVGVVMCEISFSVLVPRQGG